LLENSDKWNTKRKMGFWKYIDSTPISIVYVTAFFLLKYSY
jgi:hypothetical protein